MNQKPGVMLYFDILSMLRKMTYEEAGRLFIAILEYGETKTQPELSDRLELVWLLIQPRLDFDDHKYYEKRSQARYAAYSRWEKNAGNTPLPYEQWLLEPKNLSDVAPEYVC